MVWLLALSVPEPDMDGKGVGLFVAGVEIRV